MAKTAFATGNALTKKAWEEKLFRDTVKDSYFSRFFGQDSNNIVHENTKLTKEYGDKVTFGIRMRLTAGELTSGQTLEGNEQSLTTYDFSVSLEQYRHGVRDNGRLSRQRAMFSIDEESMAAIKEQGSERIDDLAFTAVQASPTKIFYGGDATSVATLEATDKLTPALISKVKVWAKTGGNRTQTPLRPVRINGKKYFVLLLHPDVMYDIKNDSTFAQARREALERSKENPLFSDAYAIWDGVVIHEHENIDIYTNGGAGSNINYSTGAFMGAQALVWAWGMRPEVTAETFDYGNEHGYGWDMIAKTAKPVFNSLDYGSIGVYVARTKISDA
jgi:N4-gp56 family major capsid protein